MYNFIFIFFYKYFQRLKDPIPRYRAILAVTTTIGFHVFCLVSILKYFLNITLPRFDERYLINKFYIIPFILVLVLLVYLYYNKNRTDEIIKSKKNMFTIKNIFTIILIIILPVIVGILFLKIS